MRKYYSINFFRFIAAFLVVFAHTPIPRINDIIIPIVRVAVPFFFMTSGFFISNNLNKIKKEIYKIFKYTIIFTFVYLLWDIVEVAANNQSIFIYLKNTYTLKRTISFIFFNNSFTSIHLWYLSAMLYVLIIYYLANKYNLLRILKKMILPLLLINLMFGKYSIVFFNRTFHDDYVRNFLFFGLPFFMIGYMFKEEVEKNKKIIFSQKDYIIFIFIIILSFLESYILKINAFVQGDVYILTPILSINIFKYLIANPNKGEKLKLDNKISLYIYIYHPIIIFILKNISEYWGIYSIYKNFSAIIVYLIIFSLSYTFIKIKGLFFKMYSSEIYTKSN